MFGASFVGIIKQRDNLIFFDIAFCCGDNNRLYDNVLLISIYIKLLYATDQIVAGGIDTAGIEPVVDIGVVRDGANCVFHKKMRRTQHIGFRMIAIDLAGYFAVLQLPLWFCDAEEPVFTCGIHIGDSKQAFVLTFDPARAGVVLPAFLDGFECFAGVGIPQQLRIQGKRLAIWVFRSRFCMKNAKHGLLIPGDAGNTIVGFLREGFNVFIGEVFEGLKHLVVQRCIGDIVFLIVGAVHCAAALFEAALIVLPVIIVLGLFELTFGEDDLNVFFDEVVLCAPVILDDGRNIMNFAELQVVKAGELSLNIRKPHHKVGPGYAGQHHPDAIAMINLDGLNTVFRRIVRLDVLHHAGDRRFKILDDDAAVDTHFWPVIRG